MGHDYFRGDGSSPLFLGLRAKSHPISATAAQRNYPSGGDDGLRLAMTRPEHSIAGEQRDLIDMLSDFHRIDREFDVHVALQLAAAGGVDVFLGRLGYDGVAVVIQPIDQGADRREVLIFNDCGVIESAQQGAATLNSLGRRL
jgi:hypothetical protein